jgi:elongator complex protein 3
MLFKDDSFKPDGLKIYPTLVIKGTKLYEMLGKNEYKPYSQENVIKLISEVKKTIPKWVRIQRVQRDIPSNFIVSGVKNSNLRQIIHENICDKSFKCRCIRCREVGHIKLKYDLEPNIEDIKLLIEKYTASEGEEIFFSYEDIKQDILIAFLRLRYPSNKRYRPEINEKNAMIVRELHVYGPMNPLNGNIKNGWQHKGYGKQLLKNAEKFAVEEYDAKKILVISGVGVKNYYYKQGYKRDGPYVSKILN